MAYQKTNWVNGYTPLNASNMNKIEEGIYNNDTFLSSLDIRVNTLEGSIGQGGINSVNVSGNGNAITNGSYDTSTKTLNFEKNNTFALDSDLDSVNDKNLYHLGAFDSVSGNIITRRTGYLIVRGNSFSWDSDNPYSGFNGIYKSNALKDVITNAQGATENQILVYGNNGYVGTARRNATNVDKCVCIQSGSGVAETYLMFRDTSTSSKAELIAKLNANPVQIEYKLATSYTEEIIEDRPLNTLDQSGSQWVREEWEKGLNLYYKNDYSFSKYGQSLVARGSYITLNGTNTKGSDNFLPFNPFSDLEVNKVYTLKLSTTTGFVLECWISNIQYKTDTNGLMTINLTQEIKNGDWRITARSNSSFNNTLINIMINEGSHPYPYQEYRGGIVRESQLIKVKEFNARTSTFNNFTTWMDQNSDHIISVIYYEIAGGSNTRAKNVIFDIDSDTYKYINSEGSFDNVTLSDSDLNGPDIIKIYYK